MCNVGTGLIQDKVKVFVNSMHFDIFLICFLLSLVCGGLLYFNSSHNVSPCMLIAMVDTVESF